jgi:hypothetical protein
MSKVGRKMPAMKANFPTDHLTVALRSYVTRTSKDEKKLTSGKGDKGAWRVTCSP